MLQIMIWKDPFPKDVFRFAWNIADCVSSGNRPDTINEVRNKEMRRLIENTWNQNPKERLLINDIVAMLDTYLLQSKQTISSQQAEILTSCLMMNGITRTNYRMMNGSSFIFEPCSKSKALFLY